MQELAQMFGGPLALTSANLSSHASSLNVEVSYPIIPPSPKHHQAEHSFL